jgi:hypothetical protein
VLECSNGSTWRFLLAAAKVEESEGGGNYTDAVRAVERIRTRIDSSRLQHLERGSASVADALVSRLRNAWQRVDWPPQTP